jgi:hypothetical protein
MCEKPGPAAKEEVGRCPACPATRTGAAAVGLTEHDLRCVDRAFANSTVLVGVTIFAAWGQLPRPRSDKRSSHM